MEKLVRSVICKYNDYTAEARLYEKLLARGDDPNTKSHLSLPEVRIEAINAWMDLLSADEKFVIKKHLIEEMEWPRVAFMFRERWKGEFTRTERSLQVYQASALAKITAFAEKHREITLRLFADIPTESRRGI